ncbi:MAG: hypothetical protein RTU30_07755 [Candidatus Thorarchaeota archaeon]
MMALLGRKGSVFVILLTTLLVVPASLHALSHDLSVDNPNILPELSQTISNETPILDYYLRNYSIYSYTVEVQQITLRIFVEDSDGLGSVLMMHRNSSDYPWTNVSMVESPTIEGEYSTDFTFELTGLNLSAVILPPKGKVKDRHEVMYFAKDSLGNEAVTEILTYEIIWAGTTTVDSTVELMDTSDMQYVVGTTGNTLTWRATYDPDSWGTYHLYKDDYLIECATWSDTDIETNVDGLRVGSYVFTMYADFSLGDDTDNATVSVVEYTTSTSTTSSAFSTPTVTIYHPDSECFGTTELGIIIGVIIGMSVIIIPFLQYRKSG